MRVSLIVILVGMVLVASAQEIADIKPLENPENDLVVLDFALDRANNKYVGTNKGLLRVGADGSVQPLYDKGAVNSVASHGSLGVWIATHDGKIVSPISKTEISLGEGVNVSSMSFSGSRLWVGSDQGVFVVSVKNETILDHFTAENSKMESNAVNDVYVDPSRVKWIATDVGVVRVEDKKWKVYEKDYVFRAITGNSEGVWLAAQDEMWLVDPYNRWAPTDVGSDLSQGQVRALAADAVGKIYILSDVLVQFDPYTDEAREVSHDYGMEGSEDAAILFDLDDRLWVGSLDYGLVAMDFKTEGRRGLSAYISPTNPRCRGEANGSVKVTASGGTPPYQYVWSVPNMTGTNPQGIDNGVYSVTVTDADSAVFVATTEVYDPPVLQVDITYDETAKRAEAKAYGGTGGYSYLWSDGSDEADHALNSGTTYTVSVTDLAGCTALNSFTVPASSEPEVPVEEIAVAATAATVSARGLESVDSDVLKELDASTLAVGQTLRIEQLFFDADSAGIKDASYAILDDVYEFLDKNDGIVIEIGGHTNGLPDHTYCDRLSTARANSVADYLYSKGLPQSRVLAKGYGKRQPIATNKTVAGRTKNQRVEIKILQI